MLTNEPYCKVLTTFLIFISITYYINILLATVANSHETNKQPQLQKQAQNKPNILFDDLLSSILFIMNYLLLINEPATY